MKIEFCPGPDRSSYPLLYVDGVEIKREQIGTRGRVWIFGDYVLKLDGTPMCNEPNPDLYDDGYESLQSLQEYLLLASDRIDQDDRMHFPKVYTAGVWDEEGKGLCVWVLMERIKGSVYSYDANNQAAYNTMRRLYRKYQLDDMHSRNWLVTDEGVPVFVDIGYHDNVGAMREAA